MEIVQRRWTQIAAPELSRVIDSTIGEDWRRDIHRLRKLENFQNAPQVLKQFHQVKQIAKEKLAKYILKTTGVVVSTDAIFDVQVKRLHAYKRQLLNVLHIKIILIWTAFQEFSFLGQKLRRVTILQNRSLKELMKWLILSIMMPL